MRQFKSLFVLAACASFASATAVQRWTSSTVDTTTVHVNTNSSSGKIAVGALATGLSGIAVSAKASGWNGTGVRAEGSGGVGRGVVASGQYIGVSGSTSGGHGVYGEATSGTAGDGVFGSGFTGVRGLSQNGVGVSATSNSGTAIQANGYNLGLDVTTPNLYGSGIGIVAGGRGTGVYTSGGQYGVYADAASYDGYDNSYGIVGSAYGGGGSYGVTGYAGGASGGNDWAGWFEGAVYVGGYFDNPSDQKFKTNVRDYRGGLDKILALKIKSYDMKVDEYKDRIHLPSGPQIGVIAQEAEKVFPELVHNTQAPARLTTEERKKGVQKKGEEFKSVNYNALIPVLVQAIQELQAEIDALKAGR